MVALAPRPAALRISAAFATPSMLMSASASADGRSATSAVAMSSSAPAGSSVTRPTRSSTSA